MKLLATRVAVGKAADCESIDDARFDAVARKIIALAAAAGWDRRAAISRLTAELAKIETGIDFAADIAARRSSTS